MRYVITEDLRNLIKKNKYILLKNEKESLLNIKNLIYKNRSISAKQLRFISELTQINFKAKNLKIAQFYPEKNFGYEPEEVKFLEKSEDFAEFIGIMLGDGNIYGNNLRITIDSREKKYALHIKKLFLKLFSLSMNVYENKKHHQLFLQKQNPNLVYILIKFGLKRGNKLKNNISIPSWIFKDKKFIKSCIRGLVDTDGSIIFDVRDKKPTIDFSSNIENLRNDFLNVAKKIQFKFVKGGHNGNCLKLHKIEEIKRFGKEIGFSNPKHAEKFKMFIEMHKKFRGSSSSLV